jgi:beta-lactamase class A
MPGGRTAAGDYAGSVPFPELQSVIEATDPSTACSVWIGPLAGDAWLAHEDDVTHYAASTVKLALVMAAYREAEAGRLDLDSSVAVHNSFASEVGGGLFGLDESDDSDPEVWLRLGTDVTLRWLGERAIVRSSNLATNILLEAVGLGAVQAVLTVLGCAHSAVVRGIEDVAARDAGLHNIVTARDLALQLQALAAASILSEASSKEIITVLSEQQINDAIPRLLRPGTRVAHKSGWVEGVSHDAGIVYPASSQPFVFVMCTTTGLPDEDGTALIARTALAAWKDLVSQP